MRKKIIFILFFSFLLTTLFCQQNRFALVIGNSDYEGVPLRNPVNDANDIASTLQELDFKVTKKTNLTRQELIETANNFENSITSNDEVLFYFSGHGVQVDGTNYLIPIDANITKERDIEFEAVSLNRIMSCLEKSRLNIIILDACRDNPYKGSRSTNKGLAIISSKTDGTFIAYSTAPGNVAIDGTGRNSPYTKNLISKIKIPNLKIEDVFKEVRKAVKKETNNKQIPWDSSSLTDDFIFLTQEIEKPVEKTDEIILEKPTKQMEIVKKDRLSKKGWFITPRVGVSAFSGVVGAEIQKHNIAFDVGMMILKYRVGTYGGLKYYFSSKRCSWFAGLCMGRATNPEEEGYGNLLFGLATGYRWLWSSGWNITLGGGFALFIVKEADKKDETMIIPIPEFAIGYSF